MRTTLIVCAAATLAVAMLAAVLAAEPKGTAKGTKNSDPRSVSVFVFDDEGKLVGPLNSPKLLLTPTEWRKRLTAEQYHVLRAKDTEAPFCGNLLDNKKEGVYTCAGCGLPLFASGAKFDSGTGWPSFMKPVANENIETHRDLALGMLRTEIKCMRCKGHLGHVFDDGPAPTGLRYCLNSASLSFTDEADLAKLADPAASTKGPKNKGSAPDTALASATDARKAPAADGANDTKEQTRKETDMSETAVFGGGCFWCTEAAFQQLRGVSDVESGYAGGKAETANYDLVSRGNTGHAEVIRVTYDPAKISYEQLLMVFFDAHDPTQLNRQGNDVGTQYRSAIFYENDEQKEAAEAKMKQLTTDKAYGQRRIVTKLEPLTAFYSAEGYHQDFAVNNPLQPYVRGHSLPKACSVQKRHPELMDPEKAARISALAQ